MGFTSLAINLRSHQDLAEPRAVRDKTGLTGRYDLELKWAPAAAEDDPGTGILGPTLEEALREQLGLVLVPTRGPLDVIVIDAADPPTEN
jgi:uncharacterized protein (TIGR03435 family)